MAANTSLRRNTVETVNSSHTQTRVAIDVVNYGTKYTTKMKQNFPNVTRSSLMNLY